MCVWQAEGPASIDSSWKGAEQRSQPAEEPHDAAARRRMQTFLHCTHRHVGNNCIYFDVQRDHLLELGDDVGRAADGVQQAI